MVISKKSSTFVVEIINILTFRTDGQRNNKANEKMTTYYVCCQEWLGLEKLGEDYRTFASTDSEEANQKANEIKKMNKDYDDTWSVDVWIETVRS